MSARAVIIESAARTAFASSWADWMEEQGESVHGEIMDQAPNTPLAAKKWARKLIAAMEKLNDKKISDMYWSAWAKADRANEHRGSGKEAKARDFGYCTAMTALGHGVSWSDDFPEHGFLIPSADFHCWGTRNCEGSVHRDELARRG